MSELLRISERERDFLINVEKGTNVRNWYTNSRQLIRDMRERGLIEIRFWSRKIAVTSAGKDALMGRIPYWPGYPSDFRLDWDRR